MSITRRNFVESAFALASTSLATGGVGRAAEPAAADPAPSGDRLRVAVVGVNGRGAAHLAGWTAMPDAEVVAICDCDPNVVPKRMEEFFKTADRRPEYVQDFRRLLDRKDVDVVSIATPNHWHALMAIWAMQAGKDVYVEKPCSYTVAEGRVITQWARKLGRICQMGAQSRSMPGMRSTIDFVKSGKIGDVKVAHALCYKRRPSIGLVDTPAPLPPGLDFDLWAGPAPLEVPKRSRLHYDWHWNHLTGNGDLGNQNPHEIDKARWGLGKQELPRRVVSMGGRLGYRDNGDTANSQVTICQWDDALLISEVRGLEIKTPATFGLHAGPLGVSNIWWGTKGYVVAPKYTAGIAFDYDGNEMGRWEGGSDRLHFLNFVKGVRSRDHRDLHLDIEDGHLSSAIAHLGNVSLALGETATPDARPRLAADEKHVRATYEGFEKHLAENAVDFASTALRLGREIAIDPKTERSTDEAANRLFTRDYRRGYELPRM
jgi:predicted dehydrogenase